MTTTLVRGAWLLSMVPGAPALPDGAVAMDGGTIAAVGVASRSSARLAAARLACLLMRRTPPLAALRCSRT